MNTFKIKVKEACTVHFFPFITNTIFFNIKIELFGISSHKYNNLQN